MLFTEITGVVFKKDSLFIVLPRIITQESLGKLLQSPFVWRQLKCLFCIAGDMCRTEVTFSSTSSSVAWIHLVRVLRGHAIHICMLRRRTRIVINREKDYLGWRHLHLGTRRSHEVDYLIVDGEGSRSRLLYWCWPENSWLATFLREAETAVRWGIKLVSWPGLAEQHQVGPVSFFLTGVTVCFLVHLSKLQLIGLERDSQVIYKIFYFSIYTRNLFQIWSVWFFQVLHIIALS